MFGNFIKFYSKEKSKAHIDSALHKSHSFRKVKNDKLMIQLYKVFDYILIYLILILLPKQIKSNYIEIKVNETKQQQIISDNFIGPFPSKIYLNDVPRNFSKLIQADFEFSTIKLVWNNRINNFSYMFSNITNITEAHIWNLLGKYNVFSYTFSNCINLKKFTLDITYDKEHIISDLSGMFYNCQSLTSFSFDNLYLNYYGIHCYYHLKIIDDYYSYYSYRDKIDNSNINCDRSYECGEKTYSLYTYYYLYIKIRMSYMFYNCTSLKYVDMDSNVRQNISDMKYMFYNCFSLESIDLEKFTTGSINNNINIDLSYMFYNCYSLKSVKFNQENFGVKNMSYMFYNCSSLTYINLNKFTNGNFYIDLSYMFYNCHSIKSITFNSNKFNVNNMSYMFYNCSNLESINLQSFRTYSYSYNFNMSYLFYNCQSLKSATMENNQFPVSDTREMFYNCSELTTFTFKPLRTNEKINMTKMFYNCKNLKSVTLKNYNGYFYPYNMFSMFYNCNSLTSLDLNNFITNNAKYMSYMFYNCTSLKTFDIKSTSFSNEDVKNMKGIFQNCQSITSLDLTNFKTPKVEIMWDMFNGCSNLKAIYIDNFRTSNVIDMQSMFSGCSSLTTLNLNNFNTKNVQYMNEMFKDCENLRELNMSQLTSDSLGSMYRMFYNCKNLKYLNIFNLVEDAQSITEMFKGTSDSFQLCIKEKENIPSIYKTIYNKIKRDCNSNCYGFVMVLEMKEIPHLMQKIVVL